MSLLTSVEYNWSSEHRDYVVPQPRPLQSVIVANSAVIQQYGMNNEVAPAEMVESTVDENLTPVQSVITCPQVPTSTVGSTTTTPCVICGDRSTGKHYGANSCDGCKGFFRRSVRKNHNYSCRFQRNCIINKDQRNSCRFCRFRKCIKVGMRKEAVQNERDRISQPKVHIGESPYSLDISISILKHAENASKKYAAECIEYRNEKHKIADLNDICESMKQQLLILVEWAKSIPAFKKLHNQDQISLLRSHSGEQMILGCAWRSMPCCEDYLILGNNCLIMMSPKDNPVCRIGGRVVDEIIKPFKEVQIDENEFVCLKALAFFDSTGVKGLQKVLDVRLIRNQVQLMLETYVNERSIETRGRFGNLLLLLPVINHITGKMIELIQFEEVVGNASLDSLIKEMLLGDMQNVQPNLLQQSKLSIYIPKYVNDSRDSDYSDSVDKDLVDIQSSPSIVSNFFYVPPTDSRFEQLSPDVTNLGSPTCLQEEFYYKDNIIKKDISMVDASLKQENIDILQP